MVMATAEIERGDALALLRAFTFRHELDLDTAAELLVGRTVPREAVIDLGWSLYPRLSRLGASGGVDAILIRLGLADD